MFPNLFGPKDKVSSHEKLAFRKLYVYQKCIIYPKIGYVFLNFNANSLDVLPENIITHYSAWRYVSNDRGWEYLGEFPAGYEIDYTFTAPTVEISIPKTVGK